MEKRMGNAKGIWPYSWAASFGRWLLLFSMVVIALVILHDATSIATGVSLPAFDKGIIKTVIGHGHADEVPNIETEKEDILADVSQEKTMDEDQHHSQDPAKDDCLGLPGADRVLVIMKTGATALYERLPIHFETTFKCTPNLLIVSDLDQTVGETEAHDVIKMVREETRSSNKDFGLYDDIQQYYQEGQDISQFKSDLGWNLDKWKFLPMIHKAWETASSDIDWFVMIEADTSISWLNLLLWLPKLDPKQPLYLGSPAMLVSDGSTFNHGGSGVVMSRAAIESLESARQTEGAEVYDARWEEQTSKVCCGDALLAQAFYELGINVTRAIPLIQGETPLTIEWTDDKWCSPAITWHHAKPAEVDALWQFQSSWVQDHEGNWEEPYLYRDVFEALVQPHIKSNRTFWDNHSRSQIIDFEMEEFKNYDEQDQASTQTAEGCAVACKRRPDCKQWKWTPGKCFMNEKIIYGEAAINEVDSPHYQSGWLEERIEEFKEKIEKDGCSPKWIG